jgi:hypothetical protein
MLLLSKILIFIIFDKNIIMKKLLLLLAITFSTASYSQTAITDANFQDAINTCLTPNPVDGICTSSE